MLDLLKNTLMGFEIALTPLNFMYCLIGSVLGTVVGVLPGLNPLIVIAMLLPLTYKIPATAALIMLSGIYYGSHHAGSTTAIMLNMPGEPSSIVICIDGHPMARQGRAGPALCISGISSFFAGCACIVIITFFSPPLARLALSFRAPEYASTVVLALVGASVLTSRSIYNTLGMAVLGLLLGPVRTDINSGVIRFTFGQTQLADGVNFVAVAIGLFAFTEISYRLGDGGERTMISGRIRGLWPTKLDLLASWKPVIRGTSLGALIGIFPGAGPLIASFASYAIEQKLARDPTRFGNGAIEGVAGPDAANNAATMTNFIPMLTLGIPSGATMALMLGALLIQGIPPGPQIITLHPDLFWGLIASMWIGNLMLLILNLPLVGIWIKLLTMPYRFLFPAILVFCCVGVYSISNSAFDVGVAACVGVMGYVFRKLDCSPAPLILGLILGPILEEQFRRSLSISRGDPTVFVTRPISMMLLLAAGALLVIFSLPALKRSKGKAE